MTPRDFEFFVANIFEKLGFSVKITQATKDGGKYITISGIIKRIDEYKQVIVLEDKTEIPINEIIDINV